MKTYLVGGAVRDKLMKREVSERDWVVVGSSPGEMLALGFEPVGKDFPVFLDPIKREEYALARTERKISKGYHGFEFDTSFHVTLEEDLKRRDLTINAMAETEGGQIIDPYGGREDLQKKILRHVSEAFAEDPVRVLRVARFAARFPDFKIADETLTLMRSMVENGECDALVPERIWKEMSRALQENTPVLFFQSLQACGALQKILPEMGEKTEVRQNQNRVKPLISNVNILLSKAENALKAVTKITNDPKIRFAAFMQGLTESLFFQLCQRLKMPSDYQDLTLLAIRYQKDYRAIHKKNAEEILRLLEHLDAFRRPARMFDFIKACLKSTNESLLKKAFEVASEVEVKSVISTLNTTDGSIIKQAIHEKRKIAIEKVLPIDFKKPLREGKV